MEAEKKHIETIFDHNITKQEMKKLLGFDCWTHDEFVKDLTERQNMVAIYRLYLLRKDYKMAEHYASLIPDDEDKWFTTCNHDFAR